MLNALRPDRWRNRTGDATTSRARQLGQSLTELALILPVLMLLIVIALDFGRIYLGYINVQNMARIAANEAANNPLAWSVSLDTKIQERYRNQVLEDSTATNCVLPVTSGGEPIIPDPVFTNMNGDATSVGLGDRVTVQIRCYFSVATPIIGSILGDKVEVTAESDFPVKAGMTSVIPSGTGGSGGGGVTVPPSAGFVANSFAFATADAPGTLSVVGPSVIVDFRDASGGGAPSLWSWDFGDTVTSTSQDVAHEFQCTSPDTYGYCTYLVTMTASNSYGTSAPAYMTVVVLGETETNFTADAQIIDRGQTVTFTDASTAGGTDYAWTFGDGATTSGVDTVVSHTYATAGTYTVTLTVTYPSPIPTGTATKTGFITVNWGYCPVPVLTGVKFNTASSTDPAVSPWKAAGFAGTVQRAVGAKEGNFDINSQSIAGGSGAYAACNSNIYVSNLSTATGP